MSRQLRRVQVLDPKKVGEGKVCRFEGSGDRYRVGADGSVRRSDVPASEFLGKAGKKQLKKLKRDMRRAAALEAVLAAAPKT